MQTRSLLEKLTDDQTNPLSEAETSYLFDKIFAGELSEAEIAAILVAWRMRGESSLELTAGARALRAAATVVPLPQSVRPLVDNCGTGGDGSNSFNLSTTAAIVASAAGARVAKHGNRSVSSQCGSADLLFAAGFPDTLTPAATAALLEQTGFTFFFAPNYHPVMRHVGPVRKALGLRTIFNLLGPLANPIAPESQVVGVGAATYLIPMAEALVAVGIQRGLVVHSRDGLDELSPAAVNDAVWIEGGRYRTLTIDPSTFGLSGQKDDLVGGDPEFNLRRLTEVLDGQNPPLTQAVVLNAGAVLWVANVSASLADGVAMARKTLATGHARDYFAAWLRKAQALQLDQYAKPEANTGDKA